MKKKKLLLIGKIPPPIGGVSIHLSRLIASMEKHLDVEVWDYSKETNIPKIVSKIIKARVVHIHLTKKLYRLFAVIFFKLLLKKVIITFHGKYTFDVFSDRYSLRFCDSAILLNKFSYERANEIQKKNNHLIGSFIPPVRKFIKPLPADYDSRILTLKTEYKKLFAVNASSYVLDPNGKEVYMGSQLIAFFSRNSDIALVFSDPSNSYKRFFESSNTVIPPNVLFISESHDFINVIQKADGIIRATTMDGDSLTVKEALYYNKPVFATDVVDRPTGTITFRDFDQLENLIDSNLQKTNIPVTNSLNDIIQVYQSMLKNNSGVNNRKSKEVNTKLR